MHKIRLWIRDLSSLTNSAYWIFLERTSVTYFRDYLTVLDFASRSIVRFLKLSSFGEGDTCFAELTFVLRAHAFVLSCVGCHLIDIVSSNNRNWYSSTGVALVHSSSLNHCHWRVSSKTFEELLIVNLSSNTVVVDISAHINSILVSRISSINLSSFLVECSF